MENDEIALEGESCDTGIGIIWLRSFMCQI